MGDEQRQRENYHKVDNQWCGDTNDRDDLMDDDLMALRSEQNEDRIEKTDKGPGRQPL